MTDERTAVVTGASAGIGRATAVALARRGYTVVLGARRRDRLEEVARECERAGGRGIVVPTDVARQAEVEALVRAAVETAGRLDVMVNCAGRGLHARVHETTPGQMHGIFEVNYFGVFYGCRAAADVMVGQRSGHIFNVSSVIGKRGSPFNGAYCATKFAICGLTDSLRVEMMPYDVRVTCVLPGMTETEFWQNVEGATNGKTTFASMRGHQSPKVVGERIAATVGRSRPELIFTAGGRLLVWIEKLSPRLADRLMKVYHDEQVKA